MKHKENINAENNDSVSDCNNNDIRGITTKGQKVDNNINEEDINDEEEEKGKINMILCDKNTN